MERVIADQMEYVMADQMEYVMADLIGHLIEKRCPVVAGHDEAIALRV